MFGRLMAGFGGDGGDRVAALFQAPAALEIVADFHQAMDKVAKGPEHAFFAPWRDVEAAEHGHVEEGGGADVPVP